MLVLVIVVIWYVALNFWHLFLCITKLSIAIFSIPPKFNFSPFPLLSLHLRLLLFLFLYLSFSTFIFLYPAISLYIGSPLPLAYSLSLSHLLSIHIYIIIITPFFLPLCLIPSLSISRPLYSSRSLISLVSLHLSLLSALSLLFLLFFSSLSLSLSQSGRQSHTSVFWTHLAIDYDQNDDARLH